MNKKSFKLIGLVALVASTVLLVACQSETKTENSKSKDVQWGYTGSTGPDHWGDQIGRASCREECRSRWSPYH